MEKKVGCVIWIWSSLTGLSETTKDANKSAYAYLLY